MYIENETRYLQIGNSKLVRFKQEMRTTLQTLCHVNDPPDLQAGQNLWSSVHTIA